MKTGTNKTFTKYWTGGGGYTTFKVISEVSVQVEDFDRSGRSLGWPRNMLKAQARKAWKLAD